MGVTVQRYLLRCPEESRALLRPEGLGASSPGEEGCEGCFISSYCLVIRGQETPSLPVGVPRDHRNTATLMLGVEDEE